MLFLSRNVDDIYYENRSTYVVDICQAKRAYSTRAAAVNNKIIIKIIYYIIIILFYYNIIIIE